MKTDLLITSINIIALLCGIIVALVVFILQIKLKKKEKRQKTEREIQLQKDLESIQEDINHFN